LSQYRQARQKDVEQRLAVRLTRFSLYIQKTMRFLILPLILTMGVSALADNMIKGGGFESPGVTGRTVKDKGGDPSNQGRGPEWVSFQISGTSGRLSAGLTDEVARFGKQSFFVTFDHVTTPFEAATLISNFIPVVSGTAYDVGIWGRTDPKALLDPKGRLAYLKIEVDYFAKDASESVGEPYQAVLPLPASKRHEPVFKSDGWTPFHVNLDTPPDAVFSQITLRWETASNDGETNGTIFFDDATMAGPAPANPNMTPAPVEEPSPEPDTTGTAQ
jgi:hypothetical protein